MRWATRDEDPVLPHPGSSGQELPLVIDKISAAFHSTVGESQLAPRSFSTPARGFGTFGRCSVPEIEFGAGYDHGKETSFRPVDQSEAQ